MMNGHTDLAASYALGILDPEERSSFEEHLSSGCDLCARELREMLEVSGELGFAVLTPPPAGLRRRLLSQIRPLPPGMFALRAAEGDWKPLGSPGVDFKLLYRHPETGQITQLVRMQPGSQVPTHFHHADEQCLVLEGEVEIDGALYYPGDFNCATAGTTHHPVTSPSGCLLLIVS